jgi:hypothetical protein
MAIASSWTVGISGTLQQKEEKMATQVRTMDDFAYTIR